MDRPAVRFPIGELIWDANQIWALTEPKPNTSAKLSARLFLRVTAYIGVIGATAITATVPGGGTRSTEHHLKGAHLLNWPV
jgi:hypothetical protein